MKSRRGWPAALLLMTAMSVYAQDLPYHPNLEAAFAAAARRERPVLVVVSAAEWCDPCQWLEVNTLRDPAVRARLTADYELAYLLETDPVRLTLPVERVPSIVILSAPQRVISVIAGPVPPTALLSRLEAVAGLTSGPRGSGPPRAANPTRYQVGTGFITRGEDNLWYTQDAGLPPVLDEYEQDEEFIYVRNRAAALVLALPRVAGVAHRWNAETRRWDDWQRVEPVGR